MLVTTRIVFCAGTVVLAVIGVLTTSACSQKLGSTPSASQSRQSAPGVATTGAVPQTESAAAVALPPPPVIAPEVQKVIDLAEAQWNTLTSLRAGVETYMAPPCNCDVLQVIQGTGTFEYMKAGDKRLVRVELATKNLAHPKGSPLPDAASLPSIRTQHVFDGEYGYEETNMAPSAGSTGAAMPPMVIKGTPDTLRYNLLPGAFGEHMLKQYVAPGWTFAALPDSTVDERPVYVLEVRNTNKDMAAGFAPVQRIYVDKQDGLVLRAEYVQNGKDVIGWILLKNIEKNPGLDTSTFAYTPPAGVEVKDASQMQAPVPQPPH